MRYCVLGPLRVRGGTGDVLVSAGRDRAILALLLLRPGRPVTLDELIDGLWPDNPPATARGQVQTCVSRLRKALTAAGAGRDLLTRPEGYELDAAAAGLDRTEFDRLVAAAQTAGSVGDFAAARELYRAGLDLWRGPASAGIPNTAVRRGAAALDERRFAAVEERVDVELRLGLGRELVGELTELVAAHPLRERLRGQLMVALCRAGRQADALAVYREGQQVLADELGIDPGPVLRDLHQHVLAGATDLVNPDEVDRPVGQAPEAPVAPSVPPARCLPRPVADFTGRVDSVTFLLAGARDNSGGPVIQLIDGMPGSGKTTLALHVAHLLAGDYPDAQLFVDLYGHSDRDALEPATALVILLRQLSVPSERIPAEPEDRIALWRSELSRRRALVVLDNAASSAQVAPLLPTTAGATALVTSRRRLVGLDGVRLRSLPVLDPAEAVELLARVAGADRVAAEPDAATEVARRCGHLPLALRLAAARLAHRPGWRVADLVKRLSDKPLLPELAAEDRTVARAFELSYTPLARSQRRMFRLLSLHPGEWLDARAAAALADIAHDDASRTLAELVDRHLVEEPIAGRYRLHDLIREYATSLADAHIDGVSAPLERLVDYYTHAATAAGRGLETPISRNRALPGQPLRPDLVDSVPSQEPVWLESERGNIVRLVNAAHEQGLHRYTWQLARACSRFLYLAAYVDDLRETHERGLLSVRAVGDPGGETWLLNYLAAADYRSGRYRAASERLRNLIEICEGSGHHELAATTRGNLTGSLAMLGDFPAAIAEAEASLNVLRRRQAMPAVAHVLANLAETYRLVGRLAEALTTGRLHLMIARECGNDYSVGIGIGNVGAVRLALGHHGPAGRLLSAAISARRRTGNRYGEAEANNHLAILRRLQGRLHDSLGLHRAALTAMRDAGDRHGECIVLNDLAQTLRTAGKPEDGVRLHRQALGIAERYGYLPRQADAHNGLGHCLAGIEPVAARRHWEQALALYRRLGIPRQDEVVATLRGAPRSRPVVHERIDGADVRVTRRREAIDARRVRLD